jgi:protein TonB
MPMIAHPAWQLAPRISLAGLTTVLLLHAAVFWLLLQMNVIKLPLPLPVLNVSLLAPPAPEPPKPEIVPPRPRPVERRPLPMQQPVQLAAPEDSPAPPAPSAVPPAPTFIAPPAPQSPAASPVVASQPRFAADYLDNPKPPYPALSRRIGEEGRVVLRVQVAASGLPTDVALHSPSGFERLDRAALDTVRRWKFVPARRGDEAVAASVLVPIVFSLKD